MSGTFTFAPNSRVTEEIPPDEVSAISMNGWRFTSKPKTPYRPLFKVTLHGMRWYLNSGGTALDITTNPTMNAGLLRKFYIDNRQWDTFTFNHQYLGNITCQFNKALTIPAAEPNSGGLIAALEVELIWYNPTWP